MRALWVDAGNDPNYDACVEHDIDTLYFALNDPRVTKAYLQDVASRGYGVGVYVVTNWDGFNQPSGADFANAVANAVLKLRVTNVFPRVQLDAEQHDPVFISAMVKQWRKRLPNQATSWTMESFQGGWMTAEMVADVLAARIRVVPQWYKGNMEPVAEDVGLKDMLARGFPTQSVTGFYDAANLPFNWNGFAFTQGRLP